MASFNQVILIGNVGKDPDIREVAGKKVAQFSLATAFNKDTTDWHNIVVWSPFADFVEKYIRKGAQVQICGALRYRKFTGKDGEVRSTTEVIAHSPVILLDRRNENEAQGGAYRAETKEGGDFPF